MRNNRKDGRRGATAVEFALSFMLFLAMLIGVIEAGRAAWSFATLSHAARQAARYASVHGKASPVPDADITTLVKDAALGLDESLISVATVWEDPAKTPGSKVEVQVDYTFNVLAAPLMGLDDAFALRTVAHGIVMN